MISYSGNFVNFHDFEHEIFIKVKIIVIYQGGGEGGG